MSASRPLTEPEKDTIFAAFQRAGVLKPGGVFTAVDRILAAVVRQAWEAAAEEVHRESRWALEQAMRGKPQDAVDRLTVLEKVLRDRAAGVSDE